MSDSQFLKSDWVELFGRGSIEHPVYKKYYHNYVRRTLERDFDIFRFDQESKILSMGCGLGIELAILRALGYRDIHGWELLEEMRNLSEEKSIIEIRNISKRLDECSEEYDIVLIMGVLHHVEQIQDCENIFFNAHKLLKRGGTLLIREPWPSILNRFALFCSRAPILTRFLQLFLFLKNTRDFAIVKLIQQKILFFESPVIKKWFSHYDKVINEILPRFFVPQIDYCLSNVVLDCKKIDTTDTRGGKIFKGKERGV